LVFESLANPNPWAGVWRSKKLTRVHNSHFTTSNCQCSGPLPARSRLRADEKLTTAVVGCQAPRQNSHGPRPESRGGLR